ncbi:MAG: murein DD-endopeptidase MepM/ murein hydrolase activator NlpD [Neolewinella sp.]|jgi:murein DD-endopeptidase MepM/ murein hydrolase activator NlpD
MRLLLILSLTLILGCNTLPKERYDLFEWSPNDNYTDNATVEIRLNNPLHCPLTVKVGSKRDSANLSAQLSEISPIYLPPMVADTIFRLKGDDTNGKSALSWTADYAHATDTFQADSFFLPYPYGRTYSIMQGYNGSFSHNDDDARYALDFTLPVGDTVCAAADGYVVGVIEGFKKGAGSREWMNYANFINIYHPNRDLYTQYVHLKKNGSLVEVGDRVMAGQPIGISGATGWTSKPHLHFNVIRSVEGKRISVPVTFGRKSLTPGAELRKGERHQNLIRR